MDVIAWLLGVRFLFCFVRQCFSCFCLSLHCRLPGLWTSDCFCFSSHNGSVGLQTWAMATPSFLLVLEIKFGLSNLCGKCFYLLSPDIHFKTFTCIYSFLLSIGTAVLRHGLPMQPRLVLHLPSACLSLFSTRTPHVHHQAKHTDLLLNFDQKSVGGLSEGILLVSLFSHIDLCVLSLRKHHTILFYYSTENIPRTPNICSGNIPTLNAASFWCQGCQQASYWEEWFLSS